MNTIFKKLCVGAISAVTAFSMCAMQYISDRESFAFAEETVETESIVHTTTGLHYIVENGEATITGCEDSLASLNIPAKIDGYPVKTIGEDAFLGNNKIESAVIADGITGIKENAFNCCRSMTSVQLPSTLTEIGEYAFRLCPINSVDIPAGITVINSHAFEGCDLQQLVIPEGVTEIKESAFESTHELTAVSLPSTLKIIGRNAFNYSFLKYIEIPYGVTTISEGTFSGCTSLKQVVLPESILYIEKNAFDYCPALKYLNIPQSLISIGDGAFEDTKITDFNIPDSVRYIGSYAFPETAVTEIVDGVEYIGKWAVDTVSGTSEITVREGTVGIAGHALSKIYKENTTVTLPSTLKYISDTAFYNAYGSSQKPEIIISEDNPDICIVDGNIYSKDKTQLIVYLGINGETAFTIPDGVHEIADYAFANNRVLTSVTFPDTLYYIGNYAFSSCRALTNPVFPEELQYIGDFAFEYCDALTEGIIIPDSVTEIGDSAFPSGATKSTASDLEIIDDWLIHVSSSYCTEIEIDSNIRGIANKACDTLNITSVTISGDVRYIGRSAFENCNELTDVTLGEGIISINDYAFSDCEKLNTPKIPDSVINVGAYAFKNCVSAIENIDGTGYVDSWAVQSDSSITTAAIRSGTRGISEAALSGCTELTSVKLPEGLCFINPEAFEACLSLKSIRLPDSLLTIDTAAFAYCTALEEINIPKNTVYMDYGAFAMCDSLKKITITNPQCIIYQSADTITDSSVIYGYTGSTAEEYAKMFDRTFVPLSNTIPVRGDVNADGVFDVADLILFQKWLLGIDNITLDDPYAADMTSDNHLNVFDLCAMKRELIGN